MESNVPEPIEDISPWTDGDYPDCTVACDKCNQLRLRGLYDRPGPIWCRRCKYENWDEYFGPDGINERLLNGFYEEE